MSAFIVEQSAFLKCSVEIKETKQGNNLWVCIKDGEAIIFPDLDSLIDYHFNGKQVERIYTEEEKLSEIYDYLDKGGYFEDMPFGTKIKAA